MTEKDRIGCHPDLFTQQLDSGLREIPWITQLFWIGLCGGAAPAKKRIAECLAWYRAKSKMIYGPVLEDAITRWLKRSWRVNGTAPWKKPQNLEETPMAGGILGVLINSLKSGFKNPPQVEILKTLAKSLEEAGCTPEDVETAMRKCLKNCGWFPSFQEIFDSRPVRPSAEAEKRAKEQAQAKAKANDCRTQSERRKMAFLAYYSEEILKIFVKKYAIKAAGFENNLADPSFFFEHEALENWEKAKGDWLGAIELGKSSQVAC